MSRNWKNRVQHLKSEILTLYLAYRDPRTPWHAKLFTAIVVSYALSPIDLIPDFIPVLGILDDLVLVPLGLAFALKLIPANVISDSRRQAQILAMGEMPVSRGAAAVIILIWLLIVTLCILYGIRLINSFM
jgi:uncharacterized membrane protein YkvA (DUF1232 family)